ncbi:cell wall anchor protein [Corynebacterium tapiri]|uniref:Cell wall anchor protein n=1 Tax=Corynebacterium tapiri TaxID=1448266 RepID=A0A5C4U7C3_9CORY|nr:cell wall anchor protein [Corynebacterium tapiri]TNL99785.1 cell wall anchor protein [Corynebacterium tapiri]
MARQHTAGAFDIRNIIGALLGLYGIILLVAAFFVDPGIDVSTGQPKDSSYNLYCGIALLLIAAAFIAWSLLKPVVVDQPDTVTEK